MCTSATQPNEGIFNTFGFDALDIFTIMPKLTDASSTVFFAKRILAFFLLRML